jgi:hypothetical protein
LCALWFVGGVISCYRCCMSLSVHVIELLIDKCDS